MLSKATRLNVGLRENEAFFSIAQKKFSRHLVLFYTKQPVHPDTQISAIVSKKVSNLAVIRNRLRRQMYSAIEASTLLESEKQKKSPMQFVFIAKKNCISMPTTLEFQKEVQHLYDSL